MTPRCILVRNVVIPHNGTFYQSRPHAARRPTVVTQHSVCPLQSYLVTRLFSRHSRNRYIAAQYYWVDRSSHQLTCPLHPNAHPSMLPYC